MLINFQNSDSPFLILAVTFLGMGLFAAPAQAEEPATEAIAVIRPTQGNRAQGTVRFIPMGDQVKVIAELEGLSPSSKHAFHIHQYGDATAPNGTSAGGHFNPAKQPHALPTSQTRHAGDLGNLSSDENGTARKELVVDNISIGTEANGILGRGVIVHAKEDDGGQPTGNAGARIGIGIIGIAKPAQ